MLPEDRQFYIDKFQEAERENQYYLYGKNPEKMTLEELQDQYMNMMNFLSDARTHTDW